MQKESATIVLQSTRTGTGQADAAVSTEACAAAHVGGTSPAVGATGGGGADESGADGEGIGGGKSSDGASGQKHKTVRQPGT